MYYLLATYWMWFVVALLAGGAIGYWSSWRWASETRRWPWWAVIAFAVGLVIAVLHGLPGRTGLYLETLLLLSFWYAVGGLLGIWLGKAKSQDTLLTASAAEDARPAAAAKAAGDTRNATAAKATENARLAAAAKAAEDARNAAAAKAAEDARLAAAAKTAEDARLAAAAKAAEDARNAAAAKAAEDERLAATAKATEEARLATAAKAAEDARKTTAAKAAEDARLAAAAKAAEAARNAPAAKVAEAVSLTPTAAAAAPSAAASSQHPGTRPQGIAAPEGGHADDLKLIKGIGPKNEKIGNALGIYHFRQIANWTPEEAIWVGHHVAFPGRIEREHWIPQAKLLASGGDTDHSAGIKSGAILVDDSADAPLDAAAADALARSLPQQAGAVEGEAQHAGRRPYGLASPLGGQPDDLKRIRGIGPQNEGRLHGLGIWHFTQIRAWSEENVKWVGSYLAFAGRIDREKWVDQARELAAGHETEFSRRVAAGKVATSRDDGSHGQGNIRSVK
jgi:predicted flap endonuclease-1-like 5' DNA nuclease